MTTDQQNATIYCLGHILYSNNHKIQETISKYVRILGACHQFLILEHNEVFTLGNNTNWQYINTTTKTLNQKNIEIHNSTRGGQVTYHGPQQITIYPICDLRKFTYNIKHFIYLLEEMMIRTATDFGIIATRLTHYPGIWVKTFNQYQKLGAIGLHLHRQISTHGIAINISPNMNNFDLITPCGIKNKSACSFNNINQSTIEIKSVINRIIHHISTLFQLSINPIVYPDTTVTIFTWRYNKSKIEILFVMQNDQWLPNVSINHKLLKTALSTPIKNMKQIAVTNTILDNHATIDKDISNSFNWHPQFKNISYLHQQVDHNTNLSSYLQYYDDYMWCEYEKAKKIIPKNNTNNLIILKSIYLNFTNNIL